jgi:uncharacterized iron-regulated protein
MKQLITLFLSIILLVSMKNDKPAYQIFDHKGRKADYSDLVKKASEADIVFFGELHDNPICHWLEYELTSGLYSIKGKNMVLGAEMFETDNQLIVNEYLAGLMKEKTFETEARLWSNYKTDYKRLINFARDSSLRFIATNIPRRYAAMVNKSGFEALNQCEAGAMPLFAPLPVLYDSTLSCYVEMMKMTEGAPAHVTSNLAKAQAIKDATMAYFIYKNFKKGQTFLHYNGSYHSDNHQGIVWYLQQIDPSLHILTISSVEQAELEDLDKDSHEIADFVIAISESMSKSQ